MTRTFVLDLLERMAKTFGQAFAAALIATWSASGLSITDVTNWSVAVKILGPAIVAGLAAVASVLMSLASGLKTGTASLSQTVASTAVAPAIVHVPEHAVTPADPEQPAAGVPPAVVAPATTAS